MLISQVTFILGTVMILFVQDQLTPFKSSSICEDNEVVVKFDNFLYSHFLVQCNTWSVLYLF